MRNTVLPDDKGKQKTPPSRSNSTQRNQIRVLNRSNFKRRVESNPNLKETNSSPTIIEEWNIKPSGANSNNSTQNIAIPPSGCQTRKGLTRIESKEEPSIGSPSNESTVGSLPRTLSTSVLRIKHRRTFWEKVIG